ncbi:S24 family peptidase [Rhodanobacter hydrolyticus]|uniref:Helix-turn-helix transcriptional regulator n=1 Tax=Rhodanobacter hydrolyticus TaxID=2250595 RepID=A0ABW8J3R4_9GAMM
MTTVDTIRRANLALLVQKYGSQAALSRHIGKDRNQINQWLGKGSARDMDRETARMFEDKCEKERGWMDQPHDEATPAKVADSATRPDYVRAEQREVDGDMGDGRVNDEVPEVIRAVDYTSIFIRSLMGFVPSPSRLKLVRGIGDSMRPTIEPGESVLVDTGCRSFNGDGIYLVNSGTGEQIKRLQDKGGIVHVVSDNKAYESFSVNENTIIEGRVYLIHHLERVT